MAITFDETEELLEDIESKLDKLKELKVKADSWPVPVLKDRNGKLTKDYTLKDWLMKLHEEILEFEDEVSAFCDMDQKPRKMKELYTENKALIAGEACDVFTVICGICQQFEISEDMLQKAMHDTYIKNKARGYFDKPEPEPETLKEFNRRIILTNLNASSRLKRGKGNDD